MKDQPKARLLFKIVFAFTIVFICRFIVLSPFNLKGPIRTMTCEEQLLVLEELGLTISEEDQERLCNDQNSREHLEEYMFYDLLVCCGMPAWDSETLEVTGYSEQAYWFDFEGWDISTDYIDILKGVQALAGDAFTIANMKEDISDVQWEEGTGSIHISFQIDETDYQFQADVEDDWIDPEFLTFLKKSLEQERNGLHLYACSDNGQGCLLFYRTEEWAEDFRTKTGIPLE